QPRLGRATTAPPEPCIACPWSPIEQVTYVYDPFGNRVQETVTDGSGNTTVTGFAYEAQAQTLWATLDGSGNLKTRYVSGAAVDEVLAQIGSDGVTAWMLTDHLGSTRVVADSHGNLLDQVDFDAFGNATAETNAGYGALIKFTGQQFDAA